MTRQRARTLLLLLILSLLATPWVHSLIKPYRLRVDMAYYHEIPTSIYLYYSTNRKAPTDFKSDQVESMFIVPEQGTRPPLALVRTMVASNRPITGVRVDPAVEPNEIQIGWLSVHTLTGRVRMNAAELEPLLRAGEGITHVRLENGVLRFGTVGNDPHFLLPLPPHVLDVPQWEKAATYALAWALTAIALLFTASLVRKHGVGFTGQWRHPLALLDGTGARKAWGGLLLDAVGGVLVLGFLLKFVEIYTHFDPSPLFHALDDDGVGLAVPAEVRDMKVLVRRHGNHAFVLADDMGKGDDESLIYQRAVEYLYPSRIVHRSDWVFGRVDGRLTPEFGDCRVVDKENLIVLYECHP